MEYITANKLKRMGFAAKLWVSENRYTGEDYAVTNFLETL